MRVQMKITTVLLAFGIAIGTFAIAFIGMSSRALAEDDISLPPGGRVTVLVAPTTVTCEASEFKRYCKCGSSGFSGQQVLEIILDDQGNSDELGAYDTRENCEKSLKNNPACNK